MTLTRFTPDELDDLTLRLLDLTCAVREMANSGREHGISRLVLHGGKIQTWLDHLEHWAQDSAGRLRLEIKKQQGATRARNFAAAQPATKADGRPKERKRARRAR